MKKWNVIIRFLYQDEKILLLKGLGHEKELNYFDNKFVILLLNKILY